MPEHSSAPFDCARHSAGPDRQRVVAIGEIDLATGSRLTNALRDAQDHAHHVVLDLDRITFIDAGGVRILLAAAARAEASAGSFTVTRPTLPVGRLLGLLDADRVLAATSASTLDSPREGAGR